MTAASILPADDLGPAVVAVAAVLLVVSALALVAEVIAARAARGALIGTGILALVALGGAVLRPAQVTVTGTSVGPRVVVLVDRSRRLLLPAEGGTRRSRALAAVDRLRGHLAGARLTVLGFGEGPAVPFDPAAPMANATASDLTAALDGLSAGATERPAAIVVVSDGRLTRPAVGALDPGALSRLGIPVHTVAVERRIPRDASVRSVGFAGAAVAHQPFTLVVEVGCAGGVDCRAVPVRVSERLAGAPDQPLGAAEVDASAGAGRAELEIVLERTGDRVIDVALDPPTGDELPENDRRLVAVPVARDRVRLLHLAGRPTHDVRALRRWLKRDTGVDVVAFFILRGGGPGEDDPNADDQELALIEFPVNELFTTALGTFDAVILQDIDAQKYRLDPHLPRLAEYVARGGGLVMVGGPSSFAGGRYASTAIDRVLPVEQALGGEVAVLEPVVPRYTEAGRAAPVTRALRELLGEELPVMAGANRVGPARPGAVVLWEHPAAVIGGAPLPLLSLGEVGDGRSIALALDGTHGLAVSELAARVAGRAYGALWDGLVGWLMRDPRYEAAQLTVTPDCVAGEASMLRVERIPGMSGPVEVTIERLGPLAGAPIRVEIPESRELMIEAPLPPLEPGGYSLRARIGAAPPARRDFACEARGPAWADSRPAPEHLAAIAAATGGRAVDPSEVASLPEPSATEVAAERTVAPLLPPWAWATAATVLLAAHWVVRRRVGLA